MFIKKYLIYNENGSGSGCDTLFDSYNDAERHLIFWTKAEKEGCEIVAVRFDTETGDWQYW